MVEVAGIEPASEDHTQKASTCVVRLLDLAALVSAGQDTRTAIPLQFRFSATGARKNYLT